MHAGRIVEQQRTRELFASPAHPYTEELLASVSPWSRSSAKVCVDATMRYFARRLFHAMFLLLGVSIFSFALLQLAPGDFFSPMALNPQISSRTVAALRSQYGLDQPLPVRYQHWLGAVLKAISARHLLTTVRWLRFWRFARATPSLDWNLDASGVDAGDSAWNMRALYIAENGANGPAGRYVGIADGAGLGLVPDVAAAGRAHRMVSYRWNGFCIV